MLTDWSIGISYKNWLLLNLRLHLKCLYRRIYQQSFLLNAFPLRYPGVLLFNLSESTVSFRIVYLSVIYDKNKKF